MRFVLDILDIQNILGMQRTQPQPAYDSDLIVLRSNNPIVYTTLTFTGAITIYYTYNNVEQQEVRLANDWSGVYMPLPTADAETDIKIRGNITQADFSASANSIYFTAANDALTNLLIELPTKTLDLRNAAALNSIGYLPFGVETLYARATNTTERSMMWSVINNSPTGGTLWIDRTQAYANDVISAAQARGWNVYNL